ncbi:MAG: FKBP-type peptidyl-prolyl cis-trans isomerase [Planctomycetota bacterium]
MKPIQFTLVLLIFAGAVSAQEKRFLTTPSGLKYEILKPGDEAGRNPRTGEIVEVHYLIRTIDGKKLMSSRDQRRAERFFVGKGRDPSWDECVALMKPGARYNLYIPKGKSKMKVDQDVIVEFELVQIIDTPQFRPLDPSRLKTTESGLKYQLVTAGEGSPPGADESIRMRFALWNTSGDLVICTETGGRYISGKTAALGLAPGAPPLKFLPEAAKLMKPGDVFLLEVPPELCFGDQSVSPQLPGGSKTIWELELVEILKIPEFSKPDPKSLIKTASGLAYEILKKGSGNKPKATDTVTVHYAGWLEDGTLFDSSYSRGQTTSFGLNQVIRGWTEGLQLMSEGAIYKLVIPGSLAYGQRPPPGSGIPADATLIFQVELVKIGR